jgi:hypothetical protein
MNNPKQQLEAMSPANVLEAALMVLPKFLDVNDPQDAMVRVASLVGLRDEDIPEFEALARKAATESTQEITSVLKLVLLDVAHEDDDGGKRINRQLEEVGHKQVVIGPDFFYIGALLIAGYLAWVTKGRRRVKKTKTIEEYKDGRTKITIGEETEFLNPFNPLAGLLDHINKASS